MINNMDLFHWTMLGLGCVSVCVAMFVPWIVDAVLDWRETRRRRKIYEEISRGDRYEAAEIRKFMVALDCCELDNGSALVSEMREFLRWDVERFDRALELAAGHGRVGSAPTDALKLTFSQIEGAYLGARSGIQYAIKKRGSE